MMTPPYNLCVYETGNTQDDNVLSLFARELAAQNIGVPGIFTEKSLAARFSDIYLPGFQQHIHENFPKEEDTKTDAPEDLKNSLGVPILYTGRNRLDYIVEVENEETVRKIKPDIEMMKRLNTQGLTEEDRIADKSTKSVTILISEQKVFLQLFLQ